MNQYTSVIELFLIAATFTYLGWLTRECKVLAKERVLAKVLLKYTRLLEEQEEIKSRQIDAKETDQAAEQSKDSKAHQAVEQSKDSKTQQAAEKPIVIDIDELRKVMSE